MPPTRTLLLMRHAKSSWKEPGLSDFDRPLNKRGRKAAPLMAKELQQRNLVPELVLASAAVRARQTADLLLECWSSPVPCELEQLLYHAPPDQYLETLHTRAAGQNCVMLVGHNPGLELLLEQLTGADEIMPTAAVAVIRTKGSWADTGSGELVEILRPREMALD